MASKKKGGKGDDFDWDSDLNFDIPDFGGDNPEAVSNNRKPIATGLKSAAAGFGKTFVNEARLRKTLTKSLPREYEEPISKAFEIKDGARDLYNIAGTQVNETVRETKRSVGRIARNLESTMPKGMYEKIKRWSDSADSDTAGEMSKDEIESNTINSAFAEIFATQVKTDADNRKKDDARQVMQEAIDKKRHADMTTILGSIDQSLIQLSTFQDKIGTNYMKKSLELQFRTYFIQNDMLQLQSKFFEQFNSNLQAITKNTGLPDYVKKAPKEALLEHLRDRTFESLSSTISKKRNEWLAGVFKKASGKIAGIGSSIRDGLSQGFDAAEMASGLHASGMGPSGAEIAGDLAGGYAGNKAQDWIAKKVRARMQKHPNAVKTGNKLSMIANGLPQWVNQQVNSGKFADKIPDWMRDILQQDGEKSSIVVNKEVDLDRAAQFSDKNSRSLNVVIPELLSKIHHELYVQRTGDVGSAPLAYDYEKGKFVSRKERQEALTKSIVSDRTAERTQGQLGSLFKEIDPEGKHFDEKARASISENIYRANKRGDYFDREGMMKAVGHDKAAELIGKHISDDESGTRERRLSGLFNNVGSQNGEVHDVIQHLIDTGRHGELADIGLIDLKTGKINLDMVRKLELGHHQASGGSLPAPPGSQGPGNPIPQSPVANQRGFLNLRGLLNRNQQQQQAGNIPGSADLTEAAKMFKEAVESLNNSRNSGQIPDQMGEKLQQAIEKASGKTELTEIRDILKRIEEKGLGGGMMTPEMLEQYMSGKFGGFFGRAGQMAKGVAGKFGKLVKGGFNMSMGIGKRAGNLLKTGATGAADFFARKKDQFDLFVGNEVEPRLSKAKLAAGRYVDEASGKVITKFEDIKGAVKDLDTGEIVLKATEIKDAVLKNLEKGKSVLVKGLSWGKSAITSAAKNLRELAGQAFGMGKSIYHAAWAGVLKVYDRLTDGPMDVYLKDQFETPVLLKRTMEAGRYFDKDTGHAITKVSQIKGPVADFDGNVLITQEDLKNGLYDKKGQEIKTGFDRITQVIGNSIKSSINMYKKILGKGKELGGKALGWLKGLFGFDSPFTVFSSRTNDILSAMYNMLNDRLPGQRSPDLDSIIGKSGSGGGSIAGAASSVASGASKMFNKVKGKAQDLKDKHWDDAKDAVNKKMGRTKDRATEVWDKMYKLMDERLPVAKKKLLGDSDGDGVRDGSIDDIRSKRQKAKDKIAELAGKAKDGAMAKGSSAYAALAGLLKKKKGEGEEEKSGGLLDDLGLGDGDGKKEKGPEKPRGKWGQRWDKFKGKITPKGNGWMAKGARGLGRFAMGSGKLLGRLAMGAGGLLLGGGLESAALFSGGIGMIGSLLGMAGTALGAIISSPILVPALIVAGVATAGYFAYKWMTKPDPQPIEKVRLVQYGWKADNVDAYKKMKTMEQKVAPAVTFSGEKAEFDQKKIDIKDLMKVYDLDPTNADHARKFVDWFANRFRPVYLNHRALIKTTASPKQLEEVDSNKAAFKKTYLEQCLFPGQHYSVTTNPYKDDAYLFTSQGTVERQIDEAKAEVAKAGDKKDDDKSKDKNAPSAAAGAAAAASAKAALESKKALQSEQKKDAATTIGVPKKMGGDPDKTAELNRLKAATLGSMSGPGGPQGNPINGPAGPGGTTTQGTATFGNGMGIKQPGNGTGGDINSIPIPKGNGSWAALKDTIVAASKMAGVDPKLSAAITAVESGFDANARPMDKKTGKLFSSAKGLNQFIDGTWASMMQKYAGKYGIDPNTSAMDPRANALLGAEFLKENMDGLKKAVGGRSITATDVYLAHFMGLGGARKFLGADPNASGASVFPKEAAANPWIYYKDPQTLSGPKTLAEIYGDFTQKLSKKLTAAGYSDSDSATVGDPTKTKEENARLQASQEAGTSGTVQPGTLVASPKPTTPNVVQNNPNMGPTPSSYQVASPKPAAMVASPRPSYDPGVSSASSAPVAVTRPASQDAYVQRNQQVNSGDSVKVLQDSLKEQQGQTGLLVRIAEGIDKLNTAFAGMVPTAQAETPAPAESNNYGKKSAPMGAPSLGFRRALAGQ